MITEKVDLEKAEYPCLKQHREGDFIVFFTAPYSGIVVHTQGKCPWDLGYTDHRWVEDSFTIYAGTLTLRN